MIDDPINEADLARVVQRAEVEASKLLEEFRDCVATDLTARGWQVTIIKDRSSWKRELKARPKKKKKERYVYIGASIYTDRDRGCLSVTRWIWTRGGKALRGQILDLVAPLNSWEPSREEPGSIHPSDFSLSDHQHEDGDLLRNDVLKRLCDPFREISGETFSRMWEAVANAPGA